ncbi:MAG: GAF domain-containing sensor histidine kinase [Ramlibacter sp.]|nr:GAF domain-containing sensor histidine kinase [Ramlibacter sp.]
MHLSPINKESAAQGASDLVDRQLKDPARLDAVRRTGLLDSPAEESFDSLTRLAARLLNVPGSFVSILDSGRDFYKSAAGFGPPLSETRQLEGRTFCHYTLASDDPLVIGDTHSDPLWRSVPTVETLGVRAYVGVPLKLGSETIGSFCVIDMKPRDWQADEIETLRQIALSASRELGFRVALAAERAEGVSSRALARSREEVAAVIAHDLRTPLQVLHLGTTLLQRRQAPGQEATVARMVTAVGAMKSMVDGLLTSSALLAPLAVKKERVSVGTVLQDAVEMMTPIAERSGIQLMLGAVTPAMVTVDYSLVLRILGNLTGNSIKYSPAGSLVVVGSIRGEGMVLITVTDNGRGMAPEEQAQAFDSGWQGAEGMARGDGAGLGLAIVKRLVREHGGQVTIDSSPGLGTTLTVLLPCD